MTSMIPRFTRTHYGASFYPEYLPADAIEANLDAIAETGFTVVRMGESTWSTWEPEDGRFEPALMRRAIDGAHARGLSVILGTPTYASPPWLFRKCPEIQGITAEGRRHPYGPREQEDILHPAFLFHCERIIRWIASEFANHPAVIGWQLDNETWGMNAYGWSSHVAFIASLKKRYGTIENLNEAWGTVYWSKAVACWEDIPERGATVSTGHKLDWDRHVSDRVAQFLTWQAEVLRPYIPNHHFVTHDFVSVFPHPYDLEKLSGPLDVVGINPYDEGQKKFRGSIVLLAGDFARSLGKGNHLVLETSAGGCGHANSQNICPPLPGQLTLTTYAHIASGANMVLYWHWHTVHFAHEMYWKGVLPHDLRNGRIQQEVKVIAGELGRIGERLVNLKKKARVAILHSIDSHRGINHMPFHSEVGYSELFSTLHRILCDLNVECDILYSGEGFARLSEYDFVLVPPLYVSDASQRTALAHFIEQGGHALVLFKSGFCDENHRALSKGHPGAPLAELCGVTYQEFQNLPEPVPLEGAFGTGRSGCWWFEYLEPTDSTVLAKPVDDFLGNYAAIVRRKAGAGLVTYQGVGLEAPDQKALVRDCLEQASIPLLNLPEGVTFKQAKNDLGETLHFYLNFIASSVNVDVIEAGIDLRNGKAVQSSLHLPPWGCAVLVMTGAH